MGVLVSILSIVAGLAILVLLVVVHELGHAIAARRNGVGVEEFGIGFPPRAWSRKLKNGILFSLNWLPVGGFVKLQGEQESASRPGDYGAAPFWAKTKILLAGVVMNWVVAAAIFTVLAWTGLPQLIPHQFRVAEDSRVVTTPVTLNQVSADSPAARAGLHVGDTITRIAGQPVQTRDDVFRLTSAHHGQKVPVVYEREGQTHTTQVQLRDHKNGGYLGAGPTQQVTSYATWSAPIVGVGTTAQLSWVTLEGLGSLFAKLGHSLAAQISGTSASRQQAQTDLAEVGSQVAGPIGIVGVIFPAAIQAGPQALLVLVAIVSLTLAVMNVLPIPALDGGRWWMMTIFRLLRRPLTQDMEERINTIGFLVLIGLIIMVSIVDVGKLV